MNSAHVLAATSPSVHMPQPMAAAIAITFLVLFVFLVLRGLASFGKSSR